MFIQKVFEGVSVPADTMLGGKLFQLFITLLAKKIVHTD